MKEQDGGCTYELLSCCLSASPLWGMLWGSSWTKTGRFLVIVDVIMFFRKVRAQREGRKYADPLIKTPPDMLMAAGLCSRLGGLPHWEKPDRGPPFTHRILIQPLWKTPV